MFKIGDFSKLTRVSVRMLRYYDEVGLFRPAAVDSFTNYRYYAAGQIPRLNRIAAYRDMGFNVAEIAEVLSAPSEEKLRDILQRKLEEAGGRVEAELRKQDRIAQAIRKLGEESEYMKYEVELKSISATIILSLREVIPSYDSEGMLWEKMGKYMAGKPFEFSERACFAIYHDHEEVDGVDVEIAMPLAADAAVDSGFAVRVAEGIELAAVIEVKGPYSNISPAFNHLCTWIEENGYRIAGNPRQVQYRGPWNEDNPDNYLNEVLIPISKQ